MIRKTLTLGLVATTLLVGTTAEAGKKKTQAAAPVLTNLPERITLTGTIRDFDVMHPDMERFPGTYNKVLPTLGGDGRPALDMTYYNSTKGTSKQSVDSPASFAQWYVDVPGTNINIPYAITLEPHPTKTGVYYFAREKQMPKPYNYFFPIDHTGFGLTAGNSKKRLKWEKDNVHNFHFTYELAAEFTYTDPKDRPGENMTFMFTGDDDVWVFINGKLAVDLGGVHSQESKSINLDSAAGDLGLKPGHTYQLKLFFAERHTSESNFRIEIGAAMAATIKEIPPTVTSPLFD